MRIKEAFLVAASVGVWIIGLGYGVAPRWFGRTFLNLPHLDLNFAHVLRATMGLYLALGIFWFYSAFNKGYRDIGVLTVFVFAAGLAIGRIISYVVDGQPAPLLAFYILAETALALLAGWVFFLKE